MFQLTYKKPSSGEIRVPSISYYVNYIKPYEREEVKRGRKKYDRDIVFVSILTL